MPQISHKRSSLQQKIHILTGKVESGKSTRLRELVEELKQRGTHVEGFLCRGNNQDGKRSGYTLANVRDGSEILFATREKRSGWREYGRFFFNPAAFTKGEEILMKAIDNKSEVVVIDEVGPLELEDCGWSATLGELLNEKRMVQLWVVREKILDRVLEKWNIPENRVIYIDRENKKETLEKIIVHV